MKNTGLIALIALTCPIAFGADRRTPPVPAFGKYGSSWPMFTATVDKSGKTQFQALEENGQYRTVSAEIVKKALVDLADKAREVACIPGVAPAQITASVGFFSVTWNRDDLCGKK